MLKQKAWWEQKYSTAHMVGRRLPLSPLRHAGRRGKVRHLDRDIVASKGNIAAPLLSQVTEVARGCQLDVVESRPVQNSDCVLAHHVLPCQDL